jgi:uncharacterized protein YigA (DUF484 family)
MDRTLREHISHLETRLQELSAQIMENQRTQIDRNRIESEIRATQSALTYYRKALELERHLGGETGQLSAP